MGLCKCPKRKVTNLFCFEHRVNVCEYCLIANHESCVVQTYLSWLTDSDYDPSCLLCSEPLPSREPVRLKCFHVFHWDCLNTRFAQLPNTTAPAGYKCPSCLDVVFPMANQSSPVVDQLRSKLETVNWARNGLGLQTLPELDANSVPNANLRTNGPNLKSPQTEFSKPDRSNRSSFSVNMEGHMETPLNDPFEGNTYARSKTVNEQNSLKHNQRAPSMERLLQSDEVGDSKYAKRTERGLRHKFARLPRSVKRILLALLVLAFIYLIISRMGSKDTSVPTDPMFDPHANPHIRVESKVD